MNESVKCVRDIRAVPPQAYRLPSDGRKWQHMSRLRRELALQLATYADGDGSNIHPSRQTLANGIGVSTRTLEYLLADLRELGYLTNGELTGFKGTRRRTLNVAAITAAATVPQDSPLPQDSANTVPQHSVPVPQDSASQSHKIGDTVPQGSTPVPQHSPSVPQDSSSGQPSLGPTIRPTSSTTYHSLTGQLPENRQEVAAAVGSSSSPIGDSHDENEIRVDVDYCGGCGKELPLGQQYCNEDCEHDAEIRKWKAQLDRDYEKFLKWLPQPLRKFRLKKDDPDLLKKLIYRHGLETFKRIVALWAMNREGGPDTDNGLDGLMYGWSKFLLEYQPWVKDAENTAKHAEQNARYTEWLKWN